MGDGCPLNRGGSAPAGTAVLRLPLPPSSPPGESRGWRAGFRPRAPRGLLPGRPAGNASAWSRLFPRPSPPRNFRLPEIPRRISGCLKFGRVVPALAGKDHREAGVSPGEARGESLGKPGFRRGKTPKSRGFRRGKLPEPGALPEGDSGKPWFGRGERMAGGPERRRGDPGLAHWVPMPGRRLPHGMLRSPGALPSPPCNKMWRPAQNVAPSSAAIRTSCCRPPHGMLRLAQNVATGGTDAAGIRAGPS